MKLVSPTYVLGDMPHLMFKDFTTKKEQEYECALDFARNQRNRSKMRRQRRVSCFERTNL